MTKKIDDIFYHDTGIATDKEPIMINGNKNILAIAYLVVGTYRYDTYISYHPRGLEIHQNAREFVLNAIAEQCAKICEDGIESIFFLTYRRSMARISAGGGTPHGKSFISERCLKIKNWPERAIKWQQYYRKQGQWK